ncbi:alpha/beta fold hydrolase [Actinoplanes sp. CA-030573]|uniref:alpha/beta fold hydrolase n=1 Tax=Actinoplanes sp. CA-030573 TaxID=3239898 RepID=UPI003D91E5EB
MSLPPDSELTLPDGRILRYCLHGPADGAPVIMHGGSPSSRWKRPVQIAGMERGPVRLLIYDRPGYGGSSRQPGRTVADAAADAEALADAHGWARFAVLGGSSGGPHALACAALLPERVTRCAVVSGIKPADPAPPAPASSAPASSTPASPPDLSAPASPPASSTPASPPALSAPARSAPGEAELRARLADRAETILAAIDAGGPEFPAEPGPPARDDPDAMARIRATFVDGMDGWVDDSLAFARPWGFDPASIAVPTAIWRGTADPNVPADHAEWPLTHIPGAEGHVYEGGHLPGPAVYDDIYRWLDGDRNGTIGGRR